MIVIKEIPIEWDRTEQKELEIGFAVSNDVAASVIRELLMNMDYAEREKWITENSLIAFDKIFKETDRQP